MSTPAARTEPRMTFRSLCEFLKASDTRKLGIIREQKKPRLGPIKSYENALRQAVDFAVDGSPLDPLAAELGPHEQEIVTALVDNGWVKPAPRASRPATRQAKWTINGVEISVFPELQLEDPTGKARGTGALKFYTSKSLPLDPEVGRWLASFLYEYRVQQLGDTSADPDLCLVYDVRNDEYFEAGKSTKKLFKNIESACTIISSVWDAV